jgi:hypothetical protein
MLWSSVRSSFPHTDLTNLRRIASAWCWKCKNTIIKEPRDKYLWTYPKRDIVMEYDCVVREIDCEI